MAASKLKQKQSAMESFLLPEQRLNPKASANYEQARLDTIRRNQEFLQKLGISALKPNRPSPFKRAKKSPPSTPPSIPLRRSSRKLGLPAPTLSPEPDHKSDQEDIVEPPKTPDPVFVDSNVFRYTCHGVEDTIVCSSATVSLPSSSPVVGFEISGKAFHDPSLAKIYTIDVCFLKERRFLLAAGGHGGFVSIYGGGEGEGGGIGEEATEGPLMSWKASRRWVSGVTFVEKNLMLLVSTSNDGEIVVWDIKRQNSASLSDCSPPVVARSMELHSGGIFGMNQLDCFIGTASKDSSVGVSRLTMAGELVVERSVSGHHSGVIRGICFGDDKDTLADCGADGRICVLDTRLPQACTLTIETEHTTGINTVEWCKSNKFLLLSASKDSTLRVYDVRHSAQPLQRLQGHVQPSRRTCIQIYKPSFVGGETIATPGQGSRKISLYNVHTGKLISQGLVGYDANLVRFAIDSAGCPTLWVAAKQINQLRPV